MPLSFGQVVVDWAASRGKVDDIIRAYIQRGGWEEWAQVELAAYYQTQIGFGSSRKDQIYLDNDKRNDITTYNAAGAVDNVIELKCHSLVQDIGDNNNAFARRFEADMVKASAALKPNFLPSRVWVVGITTEDAVTEATKNFNFGNFDVRHNQVENSDVWVFVTTFRGH